MSYPSKAPLSSLIVAAFAAIVEGLALFAFFCIAALAAVLANHSF